MTDTLNYYDKNAFAYASHTFGIDMSFARKRFSDYLLPPQTGVRILDLGCGSGRDSLAFSKQGYSVCAVDGSKVMCALASMILKEDVRCLRFDGLDYINEFDGVWACASLLHVPKTALPYILTKVSASLKNGGILYASFKHGTEQRESDGRLFSDYQPNDMPELFGKQNGFEIIDIWTNEVLKTNKFVFVHGVKKCEEQNESVGDRWVNIICKKI